MRLDKIRECRFRPYRRCAGPWFRLELFSTDVWGDRRNGRTMIGYRLTQYDNGKATVLFDGDVLGPAPGLSEDSDRTVACIIRFLTLKPGDTDAEYFSKYSAEQLEYVRCHGDALYMASYDRFGDS